MIKTLNEGLFSFFNSFSGMSDFLDSLIIFSAEQLIYVMVIGVFGLALMFFYTEEIETSPKPQSERRWALLARHGLFALIAAVLAWGVAELIKANYISPRPFLALPDITPLFLHGGFDSFPSVHATFSFALASFLYFGHRRLGVLYLVLATIVGLSRVIAGIHWPLDVIAGALLGGLVGWLFYRIFVERR